MDNRAEHKTSKDDKEDKLWEQWSQWELKIASYVTVIVANLRFAWIQSTKSWWDFISFG